MPPSVVVLSLLACIGYGRRLQGSIRLLKGGIHESAAEANRSRGDLQASIERRAGPQGMNDALELVSTHLSALDPSSAFNAAARAQHLLRPSAPVDVPMSHQQRKTASILMAAADGNQADELEKVQDTEQSVAKAGNELEEAESTVAKQRRPDPFAKWKQTKAEVAAAADLKEEKRQVAEAEATKLAEEEATAEAEVVVVADLKEKKRQVAEEEGTAEAEVLAASDLKEQRRQVADAEATKLAKEEATAETLRKIAEGRASAAAIRKIAEGRADAEACDLDSAQVLCKYDPDEIDARFSKEPFAVALRIADVLLSFAKFKIAGDDGGATLRAELSRLGPVFCKVGQTLATRPDIIGLEISRNLGQLQDAMAPESAGAATAMTTLAASLGGEYASKLTNISTTPVACASLAEVYRAKTVADGVDVAVKIQRPGLERKVALDLHVMRRLLAFAQEKFKIGGDVGVVVAVLDEVGAGLFAELDFMTEAEHINRFHKLYSKSLKKLDVVAPSVRQELTSQRVLVTDWIHGVPPRELEPAARQNLAKKAVRCLAMQLMTDGFIHCDPHEGNLLALPNGTVALLDFGLMAQMREDHQEAMAHGVLNIMSENYEALETIFKGMGVLDQSVPDLRRPGVDEPFSSAIKRCMTGGGGTESASADDTGRKRIVQDADGTDRRRAFGQLYEELSELAFKYYFTIPSYYILVMRAFVTLEGIALSADDDGSFNMYEATAPYARQKLLNPKTQAGRALLKAALTTRDGRRAIRAGVKLPWPLRWLRPKRKAA